MKHLEQIDADRVGSFCIDSNSYLSMYDVFKLNNFVSDLSKILSGKRTIVGHLLGDKSKSISVKLYETKDYLIGRASCCGEKAYQMLSIKELETKDFAFCYIDLLSKLAYNIRCKKVLSAAKDKAIGLAVRYTNSDLK